MDRYAYILERLQEDDCRRLRAFRADGPARFSTWLAVVARRLCYDHHRELFGRQRGEPDVEDRQRRALGDLSRLDGEQTLAALPAAVNLESEFESAEQLSALAAVVERLEPPDRLILQLRFTDELSALEISRIIGAPTPFHVYRRINRILAALRGQLDGRVDSSGVDA
jgi:RNA polymerase sigma factor (sigma-70 family)